MAQRRPGKPQVYLAKTTKKGPSKKGPRVSIEWWAPKITDDNDVEVYTIWYKVLTDGQIETPWEIKNIDNDPENDDPTKKIKTFVYVQPNAPYIFYVKAQFEDGTESYWSDPSDVLSTHAYSENIPVTPKSRVLAHSKCVTSGDERPAIFQIKLKKVYISDDGMLRKYQYGKQNNATEKVIMIVGATGSGKSTLINVMINYLFGINREDEERLRLIDEDQTAANQANSQTSSVTAYTIYSQEGLKVPHTTITIIDTPGFGDTKGLKRDDEITEQISKFFRSQEVSKGIRQIDVVGFVTQASNPRLTPTQRYIFDKILGLFGQDIRRNIVMLFTFADADTPQVLSGIEEAHFPYEAYFKFNNSAMFSKKDSVDEGGAAFYELFWRMGEASLENFFDTISTYEPQSLTMTKKVLEKRQQLEINIEHIQNNINLGLNVLEQLRKELEIVREYDEKIKKNEKFTYKVDVVEMVQRPSLDKYTTSCTVCNATCHDDCDYKDDNKKKKCKVMNRDGNCTTCPKRCNWQKHKHLPYVMVPVRRQEERTSDDLKRRYQEGVESKMTQEKLVADITREFEEHQAEALFLTEQCRQTVAELNKIALRPNPMSTPEYIDLMIDTEKNNPSPGSRERINDLLGLRNKAEVFATIMDDGGDPFAEFKELIKRENEKAEPSKEPAGPRKSIIRRFFQKIF